MEVDKISLERIKLLHPNHRSEAKKILESCWKAGLKVRFTHTLRTFAEQADIFAQGRTKPGKIVSFAKPGMSWHNYGMAIDICFLVQNGASWDENRDWNKNGLADWLDAVAIFEAHGWFWGGRWKGKKRDAAHFQKTSGLLIGSAMDLHRRGKVDKDGYICL